MRSRFYVHPPKSPRPAVGALNWSLVLSLLVLWYLTGWLVLGALALTQGHFTYSLDDAYIHMAMAKNFATHGVWGVTAFDFTSTTSSPLWTLALSALFAVLGPLEWIPLALNILLASLIVFVSWRHLCKRLTSPFLTFPVLTLLIIGVALPALIITGMEHLAFILFAIVFIIEVERAAGDEPLSTRTKLVLFLLAAALAALRYESLFIIVPVAAVLFWKKRPLEALAVLCAAVVVLGGYGLISMSQGWPPLPNSILLKTQTNYAGVPLATGPAQLLLFRFLTNLAYPHLLIAWLVCALAIWWSAQGKVSTEPREAPAGEAPAGMLIVILVLTLHLIAGNTFPLQFMRYEAYLFALAVLWSAPILMEMAASMGRKLVSNPKPDRTTMAIVLLLLGAVAGRLLLQLPLDSLYKTPTATSNIYHQQYQMGRFLHVYYSGQGVAANDIGAIDFLADLRLTDLYGLASLDVVEAKLNGGYDTAAIGRISLKNGARVAVVYDSWFRALAQLPSSWVRVANWSISDNVICGDDHVSFYAIRPSDAPELRGALIEFEKNLPPGSVQTMEKEGK